MFTLKIVGAVEQTRTAEPLPYQGSALPPELQQHVYMNSTRNSAACQYFETSVTFIVRVSFEAYVVFIAFINRSAPSTREESERTQNKAQGFSGMVVRFLQ